MKNKYIIICFLMGIGLIFLIWGAYIYMYYPGMREIRKAAWHEAHIQYFIGLFFMIIPYFLTFVKDKK
jgi:ACR3 family arsenite efflux pump ArsB